ncbi:inhibitor of apoptosis-promoting Bax1-domain-containing protein [Catenaria anguillulae PL171]|uniref:Inhibitor of apoptosis-promoting Bax1-domain-containing protein n=1 Tax=Catenaria anguillulae PL171 TaxID=765915 RepID=A0A1Y2HT95_9FUNG|nr:inhibitor of apoptosis-promoting Bax1-domain-containing protein [Catenaria anguillulae PL171]
MSTFSFGRHTSHAGTDPTSSFFSLPLSSLVSTLPLQPQVQHHVSRVYSILALMMATTTATIYFQFGSRLMPWLTASPWLGAIAMVATLFAFQLVPRTKEYLGTRRALLFAFAAIKGAHLAPLIAWVGIVSSPAIVPQAAMCTFLLFASFSLAAMYARRRSIVYTLGVLGGLSAVSLVLLFARLLFGVTMSYTAELFFGLLFASAYIVLDTQVMIHRAMQADLMHEVTKEHLEMDHAVELYLDLIQVFVRVAVLLADKEKRKRDEEEREDRRRGTGSTRRR